ncbi:MAG: class I SAM-dependent methyltransferase, partial [archaeon]
KKRRVGKTMTPPDAVKRFYEEYPYPQTQRLSNKKKQTYAEPLLTHSGIPKEKWKEYSLLDVGCGTGEIACSLSTRMKRVHAVDQSRASLKIAREHARGMKLTTISFEENDLFQLKPVTPYDIVTCFGVLHHTSHPGKGFAHLAGMVAPEGWMVIGFYHAWGGLSQRVQKALAQLFFGEDTEKKITWGSRKQQQDLNASRKAFWADRLAHPREYYERVSTMEKWFTQNGFTVTGIQSHKPSIFVQNPRSTIQKIRFELTLLVHQKRFVIMTGKKKATHHSN